MLTRQENEELCRVGADTPMGALLRRYWVPACLSSDVADADSDPYRFRLFGDDYVAFRDSDGVVGVMAETCPHRGASLALARVEDGGIRCLYHGWKFSSSGELLEAPNTKDVACIRGSVGRLAYPVREAGDLIWVYVGPAEKEPPFPEYGFLAVPSSNRVVLRAEVDCNWLQVAESTLDWSHTSILHVDYRPFFADEDGVFQEDDAPDLTVDETDFGFQHAATRRLENLGEERRRVTVGAYVFPMGFMFAGDRRRGAIQAAFWTIPRDDTHSDYLVIAYNPGAAIDDGMRAGLRQGLGFDEPGAWVGDHLECSAANRFRQDRSRMGESATGISGILVEDLAMAVSQGPIADRSREHLVPVDDLIIGHARRMLLANVRLVQAGGDPVGLAPASPGTISGGAGVLPLGTSPWEELVPGNVPPYRDLVAEPA